MRGAAFVFSPRLATSPRVSDQLMSIQDWLPTILTAAGWTAEDLPEEVDGLDMWESLSEPESFQSSPRRVLLHNLDEVRGISSVRVENWKLVQGTTYQGAWDGWYGPSTGHHEDPPAHLLRDSLAARALEAAGLSLPSQEDMRELRAQAIVTCNETEVNSCYPEREACLFNIQEDPCEQNNLAATYPGLVDKLKEAVNVFKSTAVPPRNRPEDPRADPR